MKYILVAMFATITSTASHAVFADNKQALMEAYFSVVLIRGYNENGGMAYGSGVVIADNEVVTNCHVLRATKQPWISRGEDSYAITSVKADTWHDLCLVSTLALPFKPVKLGSSQLQRGQEITAIGHSNGVPAPITSIGEIQGLYPAQTGNLIRSSAKFLMGASGSGLFDMDGRLVGINTFKTAGKGGSIHFALPVEWLETLRKQNPSSAFPVKGQALWEEDEDKKPFYMRSAVAESRQDWLNMAQISSEWSVRESSSPDAWFSLGLAEQNLQHWPQAATAFEHAAQLDQHFIEARFHQGEVAQKMGDTRTVQQIASSLHALDPQLLPIYQDYVHCSPACIAP